MKISTFKIAVLGDGGVGKTALVIQFCLGHFVETCDPTIEDSYKKQVTVDQKLCLIEVLDTAGQEEYSALRDQWIRGSEAVIIVYSVSSRQSFGELPHLHSQVRRIKDLQEAGQTPIWLVGNKSDRVTEREVTVAEGINAATELGCDFSETSAKNNVDIEKVFLGLVRKLQIIRLQAALQEAESAKALTHSGHGGMGSVLRLFTRQRSSVDINGGSMMDAMALNRSLVNASRNNDERAVKSLIDRGADPDGQPRPDGSAMHTAAAFGHPNIVNILLKKGAAINAKDPRGITALQAAAVEGHSAVVRLLLHKGALINETNGVHGTALSAATSRAKVDVVRILLKNGADANTEGGPYGNALQAAAVIGNTKVAELLLSSGAKINAKGEGNCTALQVASFAGNAGMVRLLLIRGAEIDIPGDRYGSALQAANDHGHFQVVKILLDFGASTAALGSLPQGLSTDMQASHIHDEAVQPVAPVLPTQGPADSTAPHTPLPQTQMDGYTHHIMRSKSAGISQRPPISSVGFSTISDPVGANFDIVFVHGLQGHPEKTWTYSPPAVATSRRRPFLSSSTSQQGKISQRSVFWPYDLLSTHSSISHARLLTWGYDTQVLNFFGASNQQNISRHGNDLMIALQQERKANPSRPIIFIAHSLGGILVKVTLDNSKRSQHQPKYLTIYSSTKGVIFLGTPHRGSVSADWGLLASNLAKVALRGPNEKILKGLRTNNELLEHLRQVFLQMLEDNTFQIHSFYESKPMLGLYGLRDQVVPYESAQVGHARHEVFSSINGNHLEICKFETVADAGYKAVVGALEDYIRGTTGDVTEEG